MKKNLHIASISFIALLLSGCQFFYLPTSNPSTKPVVAEPEDDLQVVHSPPKIGMVSDWNTIFAPLITQMLQVPQPMTSNTLLISDVKNNTGEYIPYQRINKMIAMLLRQQGQYRIIDKSAVNLGKQALGLPFDDTLVSRSKMIALGRYLATDLVLFSSVNQLPQSSDSGAKVTMELLSTKTGEIIWRKSNDEVVTPQ